MRSRTPATAAPPPTALREIAWHPSRPPRRPWRGSARGEPFRWHEAGVARRAHHTRRRSRLPGRDPGPSGHRERVW